MSPHIRKAVQTTVTLGAGLAGGALFNLISLPLPWLLGAILGSAAAAMSGLPVGLPRWLRNAVLVIVGLMIGSSIHPGTLANVVHWPVSMAAVALYVAACTASLYVLLRRFAGFDPVTAYFAAAPGGFMAMTVIGGSMGGREHSIALTHAIRVVLVVFTIVISYHLLFGVRTGIAPSAAGVMLSLPQALALVGIGGLGWALGKLLRIPAGPMLGPLLLMAAAQLSGLPLPALPQAPLLVAELVIGSGIGSDFAGVRPRELLRGITISFIGTAWMLLLSVLFSLVLVRLTGLPFDALFLALSPGGLSGISLIAVALGIEPAFVTAHNLLRILIIMLAGPLVFRFIKPRGTAPSD
ncbi:MAG: AbrB family transcriptional regulator [Acidihalobacter sp.]|uniref:AbrB family transcriptional regulator n=1 Tax=Acidihalobacter sp. TaxID=1872108 RepID=UPI00307EEF5F